MMSSDIFYQIYQTPLTTFSDVLPIVAILFGFQFAVIRKPVPNLGRVIIGFFWVLIGLSLFLVTDFGTETLYAYRRTKMHVEHFGELDDAFLSTLKKGHYCVRSGVDRAMKESGLEKVKWNEED